MSIETAELKKELVELSSESFEMFCDDISTMFDVEMECSQTGEPAEIKLIDLKKKFKKISAFNTVNTEGKLDGKFYLVFDQGGTFTLSGTIVMMPEKRILEEVKKGLIKDIESMTDAIKETGNLAVGSWDRIFRENFEGHGHFVQGDVYIGKPWDNTNDAINLDSDEEIIFIPYEITISPFPTFKCGVIFPKSIFEEKSQVEIEDKTDDETNNEQENTEKQEQQLAEETVPQQTEKTEPEPEPEPEAEPENTVKTQDPQTKDEDITQQDQNNNEPVQPEAKAEESKTPQPETVTPKQDESNQVSKSIQKIMQSPASLPGENSSLDLNIKAEDIMHEKIVWCSSEDCIQQAITKMQEHNTRYLMISQDKQSLEGIVSKSDLDAAISPYLRPIFSKWRRELDDATLKIKLKWVMNKNVCFIKPKTPIAAIIQKMKNSARLCLPVMEDNKVLGLITVTNIFSVILDSCPDEYKNFCDEI